MGPGEGHTENTETTENVDIKRDNICEFSEFCVRKEKVRMAILRSFFLTPERRSFSLQWCWHILDVRLGLGQDGWGSLLTQMAGTNAKLRAKPQQQ